MELNMWQDMNGINDGRIYAAMADREEEDRDWSPVPSEYAGMAWDEIVQDIRDYAAECEAEDEARRDAMAERHAEYWR